MKTKLLALTAQNILVFILASYAVVVSLFVDASQRNYLVLAAALLGGVVFIVFRLPLRRQTMWALILFWAMTMRAFFHAGSSELGSVALTVVYAMGYFAITGLLARIQNKREFVQNMMRWIIYAFAALSVAQMVASFTGLPIPNLMATKGLWSYNSFSLEPSHLGRVVGATMLCYLMLVRMPATSSSAPDPSNVRVKVLIAFLITMFLSGSALAAVAVGVVFVMSRSLAWVIALVLAIILIWPMALLIDYEPLRRAIGLISNLGSLDLDLLYAADSSGAVRIAPSFIYLEDASPTEPGFWFGYGNNGLVRFFQGRIPGLGDGIAAGFIPGFAVINGVVLAACFLWVFVFRQASRIAAPLIGFWLIFMSSSPVNTQVFWYGLVIIQITYLAGRSSGLHRKLEPT